jgi:hypothetical protein
VERDSGRDQPGLGSFSPTHRPAWVEGEQLGRIRGGKSGGKVMVTKKEYVKSDCYDHFPFLARLSQ